MAGSPGRGSTSSPTSGPPSRSEPPAPALRRWRVYGRRRGRRGRAGESDIAEGLLRYGLPDAPAAGLDPRRLLGHPAVWLEIGFGAGEHLAALALRHPAVGFIGCEPYQHGVGRLLNRLAAEPCDNLRIADDARAVLDRLGDATIARVYLLFPDPWPKKRHHKRRFISAENLAILARVMQDEGELAIATDDPAYGRWILYHGSRCPAFAWCAERAADWRERPPREPITRYEEKALCAGRKPIYLWFRRLPRGREMALSRG